MQELPFIGRNVDRREIGRGVARADGGENRIFDGEQLRDVAVEPLARGQAVASTFGNGGTSSNQIPERRECLSTSTSR